MGVVAALVRERLGRKAESMEERAVRGMLDGAVAVSGDGLWFGKGSV